MTEAPASRPTWCQGVPEPVLLETGWRPQQKFTQNADPDRMGVGWGDLGFLTGAPASDGRKVEREDLISEDGMLAFMLHNVLSEEECDELLVACNHKGFTPALVNVGGGVQRYLPKIRSGSRCIVDSAAFGSLLFSRLCPFLPAELPRGGGALHSINDRMRVLCYHAPHNCFRPHADGCFINPLDDSYSAFTIQLYLNTIPDPEVNGGGTAFTLTNKIAQPQKGSCLVFTQKGLVHEGQALHTGGLKYTLRTEAMYMR
eukprot:Rhum_TRINITY_DN15216_c3_g6::Rhum_TRINITY_DN15216_c3_g6_i3::g.144624::m.144624